MKKLIIILIILLSAVTRLYHLSVVPPSLYWDETSLGYNALSISQTLHDEHGEFLPLTRFIAFGDYKPPGYIYLDAIFIKLLGPSEFAVRLPSALSGILLSVLAFFLAGALFHNWKRKNKISLIASLFVAFSPWSLQVSRIAFEANLATILSGFGFYFLLKGLRSQKAISYILAATLLAASMYTFNSHRVFVPLLIGGIGLFYIRELWKQKWLASLFILLISIFLIPAVPYMLSREGTLRFAEVGWVNDVSLVEKSNKQIALDNNAWWANLIHNRRVIYTSEFLKHFSDHFKGGFLFFSGDSNPKLSIQTVGELYFFDLLLLPVGLFFLVKKRDKAAAIIFFWVIAAVTPAALARETPHALRILQILPIPMILCALGLANFPKINRFPDKYPFAFLVCIIVISIVYVYLHNYHIHYPKKYAQDFQYGYKQMVQYVGTVAGQYDKVQVTGKYGRPYIYFLFYLPYPPEKYWQTRSVDRDWYGFWYVHAFDKFDFTNNKLKGRVLYVEDPEGTSQTGIILKKIYDPNGNLIFNIYE